MTHKFQESEARLLTALAAADLPRSIEALASDLTLDQSLVAAAAVKLADYGLVTVSEESRVEILLAEAGRALLERGEPLPERLIAEELGRAQKALTVPELAQRLNLAPAAIGKALRFLTSKGYARRDGAEITARDGASLAEPTPDEELLARLAKTPESGLILTANEAEVAEGALNELSARGLVRSRARVRRSLELTGEGRRVAAEGVEAAREVTALNEQLLLSGEWREVTFRAYDIGAEVLRIAPAREHPMRRVLEETREAFLRMGFEEIRGPYVESAFWDFDALFQPQDHPARDMQDTFYLKRPDKMELPSDDLVESVRRTHEDGGSTGSTGWRYRWDPDMARRAVLRTHTTAVTVAACHENPAPPRKVFCVGRVFRRETIDYKHLPEFYQVDGVIVDEQASLATLLGLLREFYHQMGFSEVKFRPDFFPYTEPSVGVFVRMPGRKDWFELGGSGVFRPEVTRPAGVTVPVLAWGLGLERLAMVRYGVKDIRELYASHLGWLKEAHLCR